MTRLCISSTKLIFIFLFFPYLIFAQFTSEYQKKVDLQLAKLDLSGIKNGLLINQSFFVKQEIEYYRQLSKENSINQIDAHSWLSIYQRLRKAQIKPDNGKFPDITSFTSTDRNRIARNNVIPIGIFNIEGTLLTEQQILDNEAKKREGLQAHSDSYENIRFIGASVLQEDVFQSNIQFKISPSLFFGDDIKSLIAIEIDLGDGSGFIKLELKNQLINHQFLTSGKHSIKIRLKTHIGSYVFESSVNVRQLERKASFKEFSIVSKSVVSDTTIYAKMPGARVETVPGANVRIVLGCDGVFNKPFVIAEGLDMGEDMSLDDLEARWAGDANKILVPYLNQGYDLVFVDYHSSNSC